MNYFRRRDAGAKLRNNPRRGGPVADQERSDSGSVNSELTDDAESVYAVAKNHRDGIIKREAAFKAHAGTKSKKVPRG